MDYTNEELLELISHAGEKEADENISLLINRYMRVIRAKAQQMKSKRVEADDLVSEGFLGLLDAIRSYNKDKAMFSTYANVCITNRMKTAVLKSNNIPVGVDDFALEEIEDDKPNAEELVIAKEHNRHIAEKLSELLSGREYEVFMLYLSGYSYKQMSAKLNISEKSVDNSLSRARSKLKACFLDEMIG